MSLITRIVNLATGIRGILATANGGTGLSSIGAHRILRGNSGGTGYTADGNLTYNGSTLAVTGAVTVSTNLTVSGNTVLANCQVSNTGFYQINGRGYLNADASGTWSFLNNSATGNTAMLRNRLVVASGVTPATLTILQNDAVFTNEGATAIQVRNLPTAVAGQTYTFIVQDADGIRIVAAAGDTIRLAGSVSTAGGTCENTTVGGSITLVAINATEWVATASQGVWSLA